MEKEFVPYEEALALKELGFDEPCLAKYCEYNLDDGLELYPHTQNFFKGAIIQSCKNSDYENNVKIAAPLYQQTFRWFRFKGFYGHLESSPENRWFFVIERVDKQGYIRSDGTDRQMPQQLVVYDNLSSYEEAQITCLQELIKIVQCEKAEKA
jgi:hypothetical protein